MLGPAKPRRLNDPIAVSLEDLVPRDNFYRHLEAMLDLSFVREWTGELYANRGRPSIDPVIFFKLQLVMFFEGIRGIRSERQLIATASLNLAHRWYLGYALDEDLPDHSSLTRIRQRLGVDIFQRFFEQIVDLCQKAGLVWGRELYFDATKVEANAGIPSLIPRFYYEATTHVAEMFAGEADAVAQSGAASMATPGGAATRPEPTLAPRLSTHRRLSGQPHRSRCLAHVGLGRHPPRLSRPRGKRRIILAALVTPADVMESQAMRDLLWRVCFRRKIWPHQVTGDAKYGTTDNIVAIEDAGIRAYVPLTDFARRTDFYGQDDFVFDPEHDEYRCLQGHPLHRYSTKRSASLMSSSQARARSARSSRER
jgi:transposase